MTDRLTPAARETVARLRLKPHPEGGYYRETHRSGVTIPADALPDHPGPRAASTCILFLLPFGVRSRWHRVRSEEIWLFHTGDPLELRITGVRPESEALPHLDRVVTLGPEPGESLQAVVPPGHWQDAGALPGEHGYALVACVVAPGFEFEDFEILG